MGSLEQNKMRLNLKIICTCVQPVRMYAWYTCFSVQPRFLYGPLEQFDSPESPNPLSAANVDIVGRLQIVQIGVLLQVGTEGLLGESIQCIVGTPLLVHHVEIFGTGFAVGLEPEVAF